VPRVCLFPALSSAGDFLPFLFLSHGHLLYYSNVPTVLALSGVLVLVAHLFSVFFPFFEGRPFDELARVSFFRIEATSLLPCCL